MALSIKVDVSQAALKAPAEVRARAAALKGTRLNTQIGRGVAELFKEHFFELDRERPNALGGQRTHFYGDAAKATSSYGDEAGATITVAQQGIRQRLLGGTIRAVNGKYLTIAARAEAYGKRAREFKDLVFVKLSGDRAMLVQADSQRVFFGRRRDGRATQGEVRGGLVMFWLVPSVTQKGDPTVLPRETQIREVVMTVANTAWARSEGGVA
jgi:hypothetical protein